MRLRTRLTTAVVVVSSAGTFLLGGVAIIETVFNFPGIGKLLVNAIGDQDLPLVQGIAMILAGIYVGVNLIADLLTLFLNPRLRTGHLSVRRFRVLPRAATPGGQES